MAVVAVDLGSSPTGAGGDTNREAFTKINTSISEINTRTVVGEVVDGGAGFANASGAVALDLDGARAFHHTMTGNITALTFTNVPDADEYSASWSWVLRVDATGGYTLAGTPTVTWIDGRSFSDADLTANAENIFTFWRVGSTTYGALVTNGTLALDPYAIAFPEDGTVLIAVTRAEKIDLSNVTHLEADGTAGTGTLTYKKNGGTNLSTTSGDNPISFAAGEVLTVTLASSTTASAVSIPRTV